LDAHLFRHESGRITAVLASQFGVRYLPQIEDAVQEAFIRAHEVWPYHGMPQSPGAWLFTTARRRLLDALRHERIARAYAKGKEAFSGEDDVQLPSVNDALLDEHGIKDEMLRMMFSCCHPKISEESQVALILHVLCGFSVVETAAALLSGISAMEKRIARAKQLLAKTKSLFDIGADGEFASRLPSVQKALYLVFSGGYHGSFSESPVRGELCREAMRLTALLLQHPLGKVGTSYALAALMSLTAARLPGRLAGDGRLVTLANQDRSLWDRELIEDGMLLLADSASGTEITAYHLEAAIAALHTLSPDYQSTDWNRIVELYDQLLALLPNPVVELSRAIAFGERDGPEEALAAIGRISDVARLERYPFYHTTLGELRLKMGLLEQARRHFSDALRHTHSTTERQFIGGRLLACERR
jgi:RNA polymerase sigma factor (sigma-70 family)